LSENFGKISGKPLPAGIVRKLCENMLHLIILFFLANIKRLHLVNAN